MVSTRTRSVDTTPAATALLINASFNASVSTDPHRLVSFINVVASGTRASILIRQNRRQLIESDTWTHTASKLNR